jgi:hypothetical protein
LAKTPDIAPAQYDAKLHSIEAVNARKKKEKKEPSEASASKSGFHNNEELA